MMLFKLIWSRTFLLLCIAGCTYQILNIVVSYFNFDTITRNRYSQPNILPLPSLHICFVCLPDMMNISSVELKYGINASDYGSISDLGLMDLITIGDMFEFTPNIDIKECVYRDVTGNYAVYPKNVSECYKIFSRRKYLNGQYVCYELKIKKHYPITFRSVSTSLQYDRTIYSIHFMGHAAKTRKIRATLGVQNYPTEGNFYASTYYKARNEDLTIHLSCLNTTKYFLGYPYDKFECSNKADYFECTDTCIEKYAMDEYNRLPFSSYYNEEDFKSNDAMIISPKMLRNETISNNINKWYETCRNKCNIWQCVDTFCVSTGHADSSVNLRSETAASSVRVESAYSPDVNILYLPKVTLLDFIIFIMSTLGTWFGFVVIHCDPSSMISSETFKVSGKRIIDENNISRYFHAVKKYYKEKKDVDIFLHRSNVRKIGRVAPMTIKHMRGHKN